MRQYRMLKKIQNFTSNAQFIRNSYGNLTINTDLKLELLFAAFYISLYPCLFVFVALRPMSTAMVIAGRSVHLTTLFFLGRLEQAVNQ